MRYSWYPQFLDPEAPAKVQRFIEKDLKKYPDLQLRVRAFLVSVKKVDALEIYYTSVEIVKLGGGLLEMRIPPKRRGGVVRIYFCLNPEDSQELILLDAELKHETEPDRTDIAKKRLQEYQSYLLKGKRR